MFKKLIGKAFRFLVKVGLEELHKEIDTKVSVGDRAEAQRLAALTRERSVAPPRL